MIFKMITTQIGHAASAAQPTLHADRPARGSENPQRRRASRTHRGCRAQRRRAQVCTRLAPPARSVHSAAEPRPAEAVPATSTKLRSTRLTPPLLPAAKLAIPNPWGSYLEHTNRAREVENNMKNKYYETPLHIAGNDTPPQAGGVRVRGRGEAPTPH